MLQIILGTVIAFLAVAGIAEIVTCVREYFYMPAQGKVTFLVTSRGHDDRIEYVVRALALKAGTFHARMTPVIVVVDDGMDEETLSICRKLCEELECVHICQPGDLTGLLTR